MRHLLAFIALGLAFLPLPAAAESPVRISIGSEVLISLGSDGVVRLQQSVAQPLSAEELEQSRRFIREHPEAFGPRSAPTYSNGQRPPITPDALRFRFIPLVPEGHSLLILENGSGVSYMYKARIGRGDRSVITDVCQLNPEGRNVEHWPYPLDWIEISEFRVVPYRDGDPPTCA